MELWNEAAVEKSQKILFELKNKLSFVLIGGWACWLYAKTVKSKDLDFYLNFDDFYSLQGKLAEMGVFVSLNKNLQKYEAKVDEIDIDIYTPQYCPLIIPCKDVFSEKWFHAREGFNVILPEALLFLKAKAEFEREQSMKGFKDRIDILSIISKAKIDKDFLSKLENRYGFRIRERILNIIRESSKEYEYFFPEAKNLRALKKLKMELIKMWK